MTTNDSPLPLSPGMIQSFTPRCAEHLTPKPVYHLKPLGWRERAQFNADMTEDGIFAVQLADFYEIARAGLAEAPLSDETRALLGEIVDQHEAAEPGQVPPAVASRWIEIIHMLSLPQSPMARLRARSMLFQQAMPVMQLKRTLVGWENGPADFRRDEKGAVPDDLVNAIPVDQLQELTTRALGLGSLSASAEKNSGAPSASRSSRKSSRSAGASRAASTGSSTAKRSRKTRS